MVYYAKEDLHEPNHIKNPKICSGIRRNTFGDSQPFPLLIYTGNTKTSEEEGT